METARRVLAGGELGEIGQAQVDFRIHHDFRGSFREHMEQPLILDMAVHSFDLIRFVTGLEMAEVQAHTWNPPWSQFEGDASAVALFTMDSGARIAYNGSWHPRGQFTDWNCRWLIECTGGYLTLDRDVVKVYRGDDVHHPGTAAEEETVPLVALERTDQAAVLVDFGRAIRDDRPAPTNAADNLRTVEMVLAAVEAATLRTCGQPPAHSLGSCLAFGPQARSSSHHQAAPAQARERRRRRLSRAAPRTIVSATSCAPACSSAVSAPQRQQLARLRRRRRLALELARDPHRPLHQLRVVDQRLAAAVEDVVLHPHADVQAHRQRDRRHRQLGRRPSR